jgi:hypothetical protein
MKVVSAQHIRAFSKRLQGRQWVCRPPAAARKVHIESAMEALRANDRLGALREWEKALRDESISKEERRVLLYNICCMHAGFGDVELAQVRKLFAGTKKPTLVLLIDHVLASDLLSGASRWTS